MKIRRNLTLCAAILLLAVTLSTADSCYTFCESSCGTGSGTWSGGTWRRTGEETCSCRSGNIYSTCEIYTFAYCTEVYDDDGDLIPSQSSSVPLLLK